MPRSFLNSVNGWLPKGGIARNVSILVGGTAVAQLIAILVSPVLTRIYSPSDFGTLQIFISLMGLVVVVASGRYEVAILLPADDQGGVDLVAVALACVAFTFLASVGLVLACHFTWILPSSIRPLGRMLWLLPLSILGGGTYQVLNYWAVRRGDYRQIAASKFTQAMSQISAQVGVGLVFHGPLGLLLGDSAGRVSGSGRFIRDMWRDHRDQLRNVRFHSMVKSAFRYKEYPLISMWGALINSSGLALPTLFLAQYYGTQNTGWFALVNRVMAVPTALVGISLLQVFTAETARLARSDPERLRSLFVKATRRMVYLGFVPCVLFVAIAPWGFQILFGHSWREAGEYARYLALMFYASFIDAPVTMTLLVLEHQRAQFTWDIARLALTLVAIALPFRLGAGVRAAVIGYGMIMTLMYGVHWLQSYSAINASIQQARTMASIETPA